MDAEEFIELAKTKRRPIRRKFKDIGQRGYFICDLEAATFMPQSDLPEKVFMLERMRWLGTEGILLYPHERPVGRVQYRFGYYMKARNGRWTWAQYCPMIYPEDLAELLSLAVREGTLLEEHMALVARAQQIRAEH